MKRFVSLLAAGAMSLALLPAASAAPYTADQWDFLQNFLESDVTSDGSVVIDFQKLRSNPCFNAIGFERETCMDRYGISADFETMLADPKLRAAFVNLALTERCNAVSVYDRDECVVQNAALLPVILQQLANEPWMLNPLLEPDMQDDLSNDRADERWMMDYRADVLWDYCKDDARSRAACFQERSRLMTDTEITNAEFAEALDVRMSDSPMDHDMRSEAEWETARFDAALRGDFDRLWELCSDAPESQRDCYIRVIELSAGEEIDMR